MVAFLVLLLAASTLAQEELRNPICNHWLDPGECNEFSVKWYYDRYDHRCRRFHYSGCGGNPNRFNSLEECTSSCTYTPPSAADRCALPHEPGHCNADIERWFFDWNKKQCVCSYWTGCGGNSNIYYTYNHCMLICGDYAAPGIGPGIDENYWGVLNKSAMTMESIEVFANHASNPNHPANYYLNKQWHYIPIVINGPPAEPHYETQQNQAANPAHQIHQTNFIQHHQQTHPAQPSGQLHYLAQPAQQYSSSQVESHPAQPASHPEYPAYPAQPAQQDELDHWNDQYQEYTASETQSRAQGAKTVTVESEVQLPSRSWSKKHRRPKIPPRRISPTTPSPNSPSSTFSYTYYTDERGNQIPVPRHVYNQERTQPTQFYATYKTDRFGRETWSQKIWWTGGGPMPVHALRRKYPQWLPPPYDGFGRNPYEDNGITPTSPYRNRWPAVPAVTPAPTRPPYVPLQTQAPIVTAVATPATSPRQQWTIRPTRPPISTTPYVRPTRPVYVPRSDTVTPAPQPREYQRYLGPEIHTATTPVPVVVTTTTTLPPPTVPPTVFIPTRPPTTSTTIRTTTTTTTTPTTTTTQRPYVRPAQEVDVRPRVEDMTTRVVTTTPRPTWRAAAEPMQYQRWLVQTVTTEKPMSIDDIIALDEESYDQYDMEMEPDAQGDNVVPTQLPPTPALHRTTPWSPLPRATPASPARTGWQPIVMPPPSHDNSQGSDYADNVDFDIRPIPES